MIIMIFDCIHRIAFGGYYGFDFVTPTPPQCVERFQCYRCNEKNIIASLLKFPGYIHNHNILPGNIFGLILKNKIYGYIFFKFTLNKKLYPRRDNKLSVSAYHFKAQRGRLFSFDHMLKSV